MERGNQGGEPVVCYGGCLDPCWTAVVEEACFESWAGIRIGRRDLVGRKVVAWRDSAEVAGIGAGCLEGVVEGSSGIRGIRTWSELGNGTVSGGLFRCGDLECLHW